MPRRSRAVRSASFADRIAADDRAWREDDNDDDDNGEEEERKKMPRIDEEEKKRNGMTTIVEEEAKRIKDRTAAKSRGGLKERNQVKQWATTGLPSGGKFMKIYS